jgi:FkbM family methyltransferase
MWGHGVRPNLIYDVGLHLGEDSEFYLKKGFDVVAVEANPINIAKATKRLKAYIDAGNLTIVNKAITRDEGPVTFFVSDVSVWGTTDSKWAERNRRLGSSISEITVTGVRFDHLLDEYGVPYYLKVDIEGADTLCLEGLLVSDDRPKYVSLESSKTSFDDLVKEFCLLQRLGYRKYKIVPQHRVEEQRLPNPAREGRFIAHVFERHSSGAFGRELPGEWLSLEQALRAYMWIFRRYRMIGDSGSLSSLVQDGTKSQASRSIASAGILARKLLSYNLLRSVKARMKAGWYDTHGMLDE